MTCFPSTAFRQIALSDVVRLGGFRLFSPMAVLLALSMVVGGCAGLAPAPGEFAEENGEAKIAQAMRMAESVRASGDLAAAAVFYRRAHELAPDRLEPLVGLAQSAAAAGANEQAAEFYRQAVALSPENAQVRLGLGRVLLALDRPDLAAPELRAAIDADPGDHRAYVALGVALDLSCDQRQAQEVYRDGLLHHPGNLSLRNNLALSLAFSGNNEESIDMLSELSRELGAGARVRQNLALVYSLAGRPDDAATIAQRNLTGAQLRHNLALYESLRGVSGPRLAADVVCGGGRGALMYSSLGREPSAPRGQAEAGRHKVAEPGRADASSWMTAERAGRIAEAGRHKAVAPGRGDASSWMKAEHGAIQAIETGHPRAAKVQSAAENVDVPAPRKIEEKAGPSGETAVVSYTVRQGDTLSLIAKKYYGNGRKYIALLEANSATLAHPDKIYPGMVVNIPALG